MSHFTVMIIGEDPEEQLQPFNEEIEVPKYIYRTREELIERQHKDIERTKNGRYAEFLSNPIKYKLECQNKEHLKYIEVEFPKMLKWNDEQLYKEATKYYGPNDFSPCGGVYSTRNPNAKWDWYLLGGRWSGMIKLKCGAKGKTGKSGVFDNQIGIDQARKGDITNFDELVTFALLKDGKWYENGAMGWWGVVIDEKPQEQWETEFKKLVKSLPDETLISIYDCHS